ncbi:MAG TPA: 3-methyl-2-oxobutanoate hydroxymethyltransferase [Leptospiraceae bacterium]|nr:3-methyl-2-oxobutanoate hydroxymethyltransferase [Leptospiraceae bacterium]HMW05161.1 3-methyl-2-oxobutanoate hydroxymethyltransferase [Leptospiraceae bacterium]HMX32578.1 3-methyl-2-oxobutanoate hydroxymethyltransferase [Leptospiraceae bacterium]HMY32500.1 3-methyl-2-oxobutanoate hydroxymethyltransferase [Leptospiraceae bacterium]HMZ67410.1 3-methyl-2-oxobutanoate hydroxymethyltransferase [Leptospiraceae bacterium]
MQTIVNSFKEKFQKKEKISVVTCYDASFARIIANTGMDCILVGDSLGMVFQGNTSTVPVTLEEMIYHTKAVKRGAPDKFIICDLPFLSYQVSVEQGVMAGGRAMKETGCDAVKLEGANDIALETIRRLSSIGVPVMGHIGLTPQSYQVLGGYKVQGKDEASAQKILQEARQLTDAGAFSIVLEMLPESLGQKITETISVPTIGIGAGRYTSGQVLVINDLLGVNSDFKPKFLKRFADLNSIVKEALSTYHNEVKSGIFPSEENVFK